MGMRTKVLVPLCCVAIPLLAFLAAGRLLPAATTTAQRTDPFGATITTTHSGLSVVAVAPRSVAEEIGIRPGDVLVGVDRRRVDTAAELQRRMDAPRGSRNLTIQVLHDGVVTEAFVARSRRERARNASEPLANRSCATLVLDRSRRAYRETGCSIARRKICNGCIGG